MLAVCLLAAARLPAQSTAGTIMGIVADKHNAPIAGARVEARHQATNAVRVVESDAEGVYWLPNLDPGAYALTFSAPGFASAENKAVLLPARDSLRVDQQLGAPGGPETPVDTAYSVVVSLAQAKADSRSGEDISGLAMNFRATANPSPLVVANLTPGVQSDAAGQPLDCRPVERGHLLLARRHLHAAGPLCRAERGPVPFAGDRGRVPRHLRRQQRRVFAAL